MTKKTPTKKLTKKKVAKKSPPDFASLYRASAAQMFADLMNQQSAWITPSMAGLRDVRPKIKPPSVDAEKLEVLKGAQSYKVERRVPDYVSVIVGWRAWDVNTANGLRLEALGQSNIWEPKKVMEATCQKKDSPFAQLLLGGSAVVAQPKHVAPQMGCSCGVWAFKSLDNLVAAIGSNYGEIKVLGQVSLWGRVVETENGYRAERAYPSELWLFDPSLEELGLIYDVPVRMVQ